MMNNEMINETKIVNKSDETIFGYDETLEGNRVWYFIQGDLTGKGKHYAIWNPDNRLRSYQSYKEALLYLAIAEETSFFHNAIYWIVRSNSKYDFKNITPIYLRNEREYYLE